MIRNWDRDEAMAFVAENIKVPAITTDDFMMDYCVYGLTKIAREQGEWAARTALLILEGADPSGIPVTENSLFHAYLNRKLADAMGFSLPEKPKGRFTELYTD